MIRGTKEKSEDDVFQGDHLHQIPILTGLRIAFHCFILREQFGYRYARSACKESSKLYGDFGNNRCNRRLFSPFPLSFYPMHLSSRGLESLQVHLNTPIGEPEFKMPTYMDFSLWNEWEGANLP